MVLLKALKYTPISSGLRPALLTQEQDYILVVVTRSPWLHMRLIPSLLGIVVSKFSSPQPCSLHVRPPISDSISDAQCLGVRQPYSFDDNGVSIFNTRTGLLISVGSNFVSYKMHDSVRGGQRTRSGYYLQECKCVDAHGEAATSADGNGICMFASRKEMKGSALRWPRP